MALCYPAGVALRSGTSRKKARQRKRSDAEATVLQQRGEINPPIASFLLKILLEERIGFERLA